MHVTSMTRITQSILKTVHHLFLLFFNTEPVDDHNKISPSAFQKWRERFRKCYAMRIGNVSRRIAKPKPRPRNIHLSSDKKQNNNKKNIDI